MIEGNWGAIKLPLTYDANRLRDEVAQITDAEWGGGGRTAAAFVDTKAIFLKGYAAASGNPSLEDRDALKNLHYARELIYSLIPAEPQKCVLSYLPPKVDVGLHIDNGAYFKNTLRLHFPVWTNEKVTMYFGACYYMKPGEVWLLNNTAPHGVENKHETKPRVHMICDYLPSLELMQLIETSDTSLGKSCPQLHEKLLLKTKMHKQS